MIVILMGAARSGTSFYARALHTMGAYFGRHVTRESDELNPKGYFENVLANNIENRLNQTLEPGVLDRGVVNKVRRKILARGKGCKWYKYYSFKHDPAWEFPQDTTLKDVDIVTRGAMEGLFTDLDSREVGVVKQPDMPYTYPFWEEAIEDLGIEYKIVSVFRNPVAVANSRIRQCEYNDLAAGGMGGFIREWTSTNRLLLKWMRRAEARGVEVLWSDFDWPPERILERLEHNCSRLGLDFDRRKTANLIDPSLRRSPGSIEDAGDPEALEVYRELREASEAPPRKGLEKSALSGG